ncbi:peptidase M48 [Methanobrevibacter sp. YE315]|uniref:M48 family metallopeptidase n=1 Tax=Methanobrevibacter sp. YE315 TaxID=1609968 RepID=UPI000764E4A8|nr:M48 family metallopeptidase [Methanobrevibacter sp. YE315]AMD18116.1 peptidase M48 [Methanobrevibacter sp. YE315]
MAKNDRSGVNPFTGKKHFDIVNDDKFLQQSYNEYYAVINKSQLLDNTPEGQLVRNVAVNLINAVQNYLANIGRLDYIENYYDWDFHLVADKTVNAFCMPGGKIVMFSGILSVANTEEKVAFILGHEMAHALLDHSRTRASAQTAHNAITSAAWVGSIAMDLFGLGAIGNLTRAATNLASMGSHYLLLNPWGRDQELEADRLGMLIIHWAGYDISHIPAFWESMSAKNSNEHDFFSTHPSDSKRIAAMNDLIVEIENQKDFYSSPVIDNSLKPKNDDNKPQGNVKRCQKCGTPCESDAKFCTNCGSEFVDELRCPNCGASIEKDSSFCINCGFKL